MSDDDVPRMGIFDRDEVDLLALRRVMREAEIRVSDTCDAELEDGYQREMDRAIDKRAAYTAGEVAARDCLRFDGQVPAPDGFGIRKERRYSMYAMHPDTAEQVIKAMEFLIERFGARFLVPTRPTRIVAKTVRNDTGLSEAKGDGGNE